MKSLLLLFALLLVAIPCMPRTLHVNGESGGGSYPDIRRAALDAMPGDTILVYPDLLGPSALSGGIYIENLKGEPDKLITMTCAESSDYVLIEGGATGIHFVNPEYLLIEKFAFSRQWGNGVNIDDGGDYSSPARHIRIRDCKWLSMDASGNNDELKMSGVDDFLISNCAFLDGSDGGSLIDMVGCHFGIIEKCRFENGGSNSIQAKGGCSDLVIRQNYFMHGGQRSINIGGSTGMEFFRPIDAEYEAGNLLVHSNAFVGSTAPIAFVGAVNCRVVNNTIIRPDKWVIRILQENNHERLVKCRENYFINNIVYIGTAAQNPSLNIGPNTIPETFIFENNLWYNSENTDWPGPNLPSEETAGIIGEQPLFRPDVEFEFRLRNDSPGIGMGKAVTDVNFDYEGNPFNDPPSIGASEGNIPNSIFEIDKNNVLKIYPNPCSENADLILSLFPGKYEISLYTILGIKIIVLYDGFLDGGMHRITVDTRELATGTYLVALNGKVSQMITLKVIQ